MDLVVAATVDGAVGDPSENMLRQPLRAFFVLFDAFRAENGNLSQLS